MSYCKDYGKDKVIFATKEDHEKPSTVAMPPEDDSPRGLILPNGDINWNCPCLGGTASGPCAFEFREAFSCFHTSTSDPKGSDCLERFQEMSKCMASYPTLYPKDENEDRQGWDQERLEKEVGELDDEKVLDELNSDVKEMKIMESSANEIKVTGDSSKLSGDEKNS